MGSEVEVMEPQPKARKSKALAAVTPAAMITQAIASGAGVEVMEKLMGLHERWEAMQARKSFDDAMAALRQNMPTVVKSQQADFGNGGASYKFEDLSAVTEALSPIMAGVGLSFRWRTNSTPTGVEVTCIVSHRDGHSEETTLASGFDTSGKKNPIQALGSAVTYLQRYTLKAAVGVAAAKDDDAIEAGRTVQAAPAKPTEPVKLTGRAINAETALRAAKSVGELDAVWEKIKAVPADQIPDDQYHALGRIADDLAKKLPKEATKTATADDFPGDLTATATLDRQFGAAAA
jgi:hypothetical protein